MSTIKVRRLDENWDPVYGSGQNDYLTDLDAVSQIIRSRLLLFKGEWWEDLNVGIPMWQSILGVMGAKKLTVDKIIMSYLKACPYVVAIKNFQSTLSNREYICQATVDTAFGAVYVTNGG